MFQVPPPDKDTIWVNKEDGIRSRKEFVRHAKRSWGETSCDVPSTLWQGVKYSLRSFQKRKEAARNATRFPQFDNKEALGSGATTEKLGLAILFHGLNGQPSLFDGHTALLKKYSNVDVIAPELPDAGHKSLHDKTKKVFLERVVAWTKENPGKPVAIFGQSIGTRDALKLEIMLRDHAPKAPVHLSLTAGVLYGTSTMNLGKKLMKIDHIPKVTFGMVSRENCQEIGFGSKTAKELVQAAREPLKEGVAPRDYSLYASMHDHLHVPDTGSSLPILVPEDQKSKKERHFIVFSHGHNALPLATKEKQVSDCISWMKSQMKTR